TRVSQLRAGARCGAGVSVGIIRPGPMTDRIARVRAEMDAAGLDALLVAAPPNLGYLVGFRPNPHERLIALVVPRYGEPRLVCPGLEEEAAASATGGSVEIQVWDDHEGPAEALGRALSGAGKRVGIEKRYLPVANAELAAAAAPGIVIDSCDELLA